MGDTGFGLSSLRSVAEGLFNRRGIVQPDADSLFVETVDFGPSGAEGEEGERRTIVSGLVGRVSIEQLQILLAVFVCNLKPVKMRGIESQGMLLCAMNENVTEPVPAPPNALPGDPVLISCPLCRLRALRSLVLEC